MPLRSDFLPADGWQQLNERIEAVLDCAMRGCHAKVYHGLPTALAELCQGLQKQFPHKKKILHVRDQDPLIAAQVQMLAREGLEIVDLSLSEIENKDFLERKIGPDALYCLYAEDTPLIGALAPIAELERVLIEKKVVRIRVSHLQHEFQALPKLDRGEVRIWSLASDLALVQSGERIRWPQWIGEGQVFPPATLSIVSQLKTTRPLNCAKVLAFENQVTAVAAVPVFSGTATAASQTAGRLFDRAVIYWRDLDGSALIERLAKVRGQELPAAGAPTDLEATSLHRWGGFRTMEWLKSYGWSDEMIRGGVILSESILDETLLSQIKQVREEILRDQFGQDSG